MELDKLLRIIGLVMMGFAIVSGVFVKISSNGGEWNIDSGYSFKIGLFLVGVVIYYLARKTKK
ncbi:hypothetical protein [Acidiluteibacter ferrifornacis]|uniref:Uncharacterized protein n=1 Tax=Acidiluteibacter ferrifornacis TaxID=2692424 RepID=A0A6N9NKQ1_9FLAO|nr:hypothetical protein [Acidiluteibacter ferrifornacis]MBR9831980.1 hypothetical protein [bacterium]NBG65205.1 hypothetical protein [Acidiluteibacter ferrifornacis]